MDIIWIIVFLLISYLGKGLLWVIIDVFFLKTIYNDITQLSVNIILWPIPIIIKLINKIKQLF